MSIHEILLLDYLTILHKPFIVFSVILVVLKIVLKCK